MFLQLSNLGFPLRWFCLAWIAAGTLSQISLRATGQEQRTAERIEWTQFRGTNNAGVSDSTLPSSWDDDAYQWRVKLAGSGNGSPVVWQQRVYIASCDQESGQIFLECRNLSDGKQVWQKEFRATSFRMHSRSSYASSTPAVTSDAIYFSFADPDETVVVAMDHDGKQLWQRDLGSWVSQHGFGVSPIVHQDSVIFLQSQQAQQLRGGQKPGTSRMVSLSCADGSIQWETQLTATRACYGLPCLLESENAKPQLVGCNTGDGFYSIDPDNGEMNWTLPAFRQRVVASPILAGGLLIGTCGSGGGGNTLVAIRPATANKQAEKVYEIRQNACYVPTPIAVGNQLYMFSDRGIVSCLELETGELIWRERVSAGFSGSPVADAAHLYCIDELGQLFVIKHGTDSFELTAKIDLGEPSRATPAITGNSLLLRTDTRLMLVSGERDAP